MNVPRVLPALSPVDAEACVRILRRLGDARRAPSAVSELTEPTLSRAASSASSVSVGSSAEPATADPAGATTDPQPPAPDTAEDGKNGGAEAQAPARHTQTQTLECLQLQNRFYALLVSLQTLGRERDDLRRALRSLRHRSATAAAPAVEEAPSLAPTSPDPRAVAATEADNRRRQAALRELDSANGRLRERAEALEAEVAALRKRQAIRRAARRGPSSSSRSRDTAPTTTLAAAASAPPASSPPPAPDPVCGAEAEMAQWRRKLREETAALEADRERLCLLLYRHRGRLQAMRDARAILGDSQPT